jgi:hypothetical protein
MVATGTQAHSRYKPDEVFVGRPAPTELYRTCCGRPTGRKIFHPVSSGVNWDNTNFKFLI